MSQTPFEEAGGLHIGVVDFASPDEIKVGLDIDSPESVALNAGVPRPFPRVNGYLLIPVDVGFLVGQIEWMTVERSPFPKRRGMQDFGLVDLPYPLRRLSLNPLGTLRVIEKMSEEVEGAHEKYAFSRGADALPTIGDAVLLPTERQLRAIVESGEQRRVQIGTSPLAGDAAVCVDPDRIFGRHLAVLGNTGSGKSCSVAGLIRWSIEAAQAKKNGKVPNARFVVLDPNGEYSRAFKSTDPKVKARIFKVNPVSDNGEEALKVPLWFWNSAEWCSFTQASAKTQRPALLHALRFVRDGSTESMADPSHEMRRYLRTLLMSLRIDQNKGTPWSPFPKSMHFYDRLAKWKKGLESDEDTFDGDQAEKLNVLISVMDEICNPHREAKYPKYDFDRTEIQHLFEMIKNAHSAFGGSLSDTIPPDVDAPRRFDGESLLRGVEAAGEILGVSEHIETLLVRIKALLTDARMQQIVTNEGDMTLEQWLRSYVGDDKLDNGCVSVIDLSLVPTDVIHIVTAVIARIIFEAQQRYLKHNPKTLPTVLVMEEAHTFVKKYRDDAENQDAASVCCQVFERIAREGRKFGLGLVLSSQRPSELSPTVLSQCNSFLLHRISNDRDQELVHRFVPDNLRGLLRDLPSLPSQSAILMGWASELPILVKMNNLPKEQQPRSDDPDFWNVWVGKDEAGKEVKREVNWSKIVEDWQNPNTDESENSGG